MDKIYEKRDNETLEGLIMEEKFSLIKIKDNQFIGKYPLEPYFPGQQGTYGGDFVSQATLAAYESLEDPNFTLNSLHSYFLKAGSVKSSIRYEVEENSKGKSFVNKTVRAIQDHTNTLVFLMVCSFTPNNSIKNRKIEYAEGKSKRVPYEWIKTPGKVFHDYIGKLEEQDDLFEFVHTHDLVVHAVPSFYMKHANPKLEGNIGDRQLGFFCKVLDIAPTSEKMKAVDFLYLTDSFYFGLLGRTLGMPLSQELTDFFRVSLDHTVHIHDMDYNPTEWLYLDYQFSRLANSRVMCQVYFYNLEGRLIATVNQEGLMDLPKSWLPQIEGGTYKL